MVKILKYDNSCQIINEDDPDFIAKLDRELSFSIPGAEFSKAFKGYINDRGEEVTWDGKKHLLSGSLRFPIGLIDRVYKFYKKHNRNIEIEDCRKIITTGNPIDISKNIEKLNITPRQYQIDSVNTALNYDRGIIKVATGGGKCNSIDSLNITDFGILDYSELLKINNITLNKGEAAKFISKVGTPLTKNMDDKSSMIYYDGYGNSIKIKTNYGFELTGTKNHKIKVLDDNGDIIWKNFGSIKTGDYAIISYGLKMFGKDNMALDEAYWYGLLYGDSSLTLSNNVNLTKYIKKLKEEIGTNYSNSIYKTIPMKIRMLQKAPLAMFIRGLYEADGWVEDHKICIKLLSSKLTRQLQIILLNFGIVSSVRIKKTTHNDFYLLTIYKDFIEIFDKEVGFDPKGKKHKKLRKTINTLNKKNANTLIVPNQNKKIEQLLENIKEFENKISFFNDCPVQYGMIKSWSRNASFRFPSNKNLKLFLQWTKNKLLNNYKNKNIQELINLIDDMLNVCNIGFFDKIKNTVKTKTENYDFVIPNTHSFVSQGFINHNTLITSLLTAKIGKPTIIFVIGKDLLYQFHKFFSKVFDEEIGIIGDGQCEIRRINIVSIWSVGKIFNVKDVTLDEESQDEEDIKKEKYKYIKQMLLDARLIIVDECHMASCETIQTIAHHVKTEHFYGFSASPWRDDNSDLLIEAVLGSRIVDVNARYLIDNGFLVNPIIRFVAVPPYEGKKRAHYKTVYKNYITVNPKRNAIIAKAAQKLVEQGYKPLVLYKNKAHGKILFDLLSKNLRCALLSGDNDQKTRDKVKSQIENGEIDCIIASVIFDVGLDLPILSGLIIASGGKSSVRALQRVGRVIRLFPGKKNAAVIDFCDQAPYLRGHSETRRDILKEEFEVAWPEEKKQS